ncbi:hypothetical protein AB3N59_14120 [Leptospira sp. WS92.C1]
MRKLFVIRQSISISFFLCALILPGNQDVFASTVIHCSIGTLLFHSDVIVEAKLDSDPFQTVAVKKVYYGPLKMEDKINLPLVHRLTHFVHDHDPANRNISVKNGTLLLFLQWDSRQNDYYPKICLASGVMWIHENKIYKYMQPWSWANYLLLLSETIANREELDLLLEEGMKRRVEFERISALGDVDLKIEGLSSLLRSIEPEYCYARAADELVLLGEKAREIVRVEFGRSEVPMHRKRLLYALTSFQDEQSYFLYKSVIERSKRILAESGEIYSERTASDTEKAAFHEWQIVLKEMSKLKEKAVTDQINETLRWSIQNEDVLLFATAVEQMWQVGSSAKVGVTSFINIYWDVLERIQIEKKIKRDFYLYTMEEKLSKIITLDSIESIPFLISLLNYPSKLRSSAYYRLKNITGRDFGFDEKKWMGWFFETRKK